ncbi:MAG TPA: UDP-N-acetylmuramoyl-L-alanine--D-glutamate ligase [Steroidobacteraceae bacterium]|jgi:UDP-N-acetylmuramoylalanine--D-glutamate ligase|nr:UDP-N-acetylmuramoyl-L-alanine--D-glutamate ligase [Steroidobacteraceae bacterium]
MSPLTANPPYAVIAGLGATGLSCARYLHGHGWRIAVTDTRAAPPQLAALSALDAHIPARLGHLDPELLEGAMCVVASPGLPLRGPFFEEARRRGLAIVGDIELFARAAAAPVVGVTGTNGKSTVTTLVARMAQRAGVKVRAGGNLGPPALDLLAAGTELYVLELSSYQLETTTSLHCRAATVLNLSADHLDRYASLASYAAAKARIFARCDTAVINLDDPLVLAMPRSASSTLSFSLRASVGATYALALQENEWWLMRAEVPLLRLAELKLRGAHNAANALAALALGEALALPLTAMLEELRSFAGLAHRSQWIADVRGVAYIDDSKGTNVGATVAAVAGIPGPLVLIAGGDGKNQDFAPLAAAFHGKVRHVVLIGRDAARIAAALEGVCPIERCATLPQAVQAAARAAHAGDTVLLSPACASFDMFRDYAHRAAVFAEAVQELAA